MDFSLDGKLIISGSRDSTVRVWDMNTGACKQIITITEPGGIDTGVLSAVISPDGYWIAAGSADNIVRIWDVSTGALVERLLGHKKIVYSVAFTPDGKGLVSGSWDKTAKHWDITPMVRAVAQAGGANRVLLRRNKGGSELGSTCTVEHTGQNVGLLFFFLPRLVTSMLLVLTYPDSLACRAELCLLLFRLMVRGFHPARRIAFRFGTSRTAKLSSRSNIGQVCYDILSHFQRW